MQTPAPKIADALHKLARSPALRELENRLSAQNAFTLFDAIGVSNQELRHSDFLAFLLRPDEAHGLSDAFLKWFLNHALAASPAPPISRDAVNAWDLTDAHVQREWNNVDLFITSAQNRLAIVVENKIYTGEHSDQLARYKAIAEAHGHGGPDRTLLCVFLTPYGGKPTHADYLPIGYEAVCAHLETLCRSGAFAHAASPDVETVVHHYTRMLRRKIVGDPEITKLCRELYANNQAAFERVWAEVKSKEIQKATTNQLSEWIGNIAGFETGTPHFYKGISISHFRPKSWASKASSLSNKQDTWFIYLQTETYSDGKVLIAGIIAPCEPTLRTHLLQIVNSLPQSTTINAGNGYIAFYVCPLRPACREDDDMLRVAWQKWAETEGPKFANLIEPGDFPAAS